MILYSKSYLLTFEDWNGRCNDNTRLVEQFNHFALALKKFIISISSKSFKS